MTWALFDSYCDPSVKYPNSGSRPASRARGFAATSHKDGHMTRAIRDLFDSCNIAMVFDELHYRTHSATDGYDDYVGEVRTKYAPKQVDQADAFRVKVLQASRDAFYGKLADLLIEGVAS